MIVLINVCRVTREDKYILGSLFQAQQTIIKHLYIIAQLCKIIFIMTTDLKYGIIDNSY